MHKGVILLLKADDRESAKQQAEDFLEGYQNDVWDWYVIGGRWTGKLSGYDPHEDSANVETCKICSGTGKRMDSLGIKAREENPDYTCNGCEGKGDCYKWPTEWVDHDGDILPLGDCFEKVKEYRGDLEAQIEEEEKRMREYALKGDRSMRGYLMKNIGEMLCQDFSFEANVYNIESGDYSLPSDTDGFWAVMVDMHN